MNDLVRQQYQEDIEAYVNDPETTAEVVPAEISTAVEVVAKKQAMEALVEQRKREIVDWAKEKGYNKQVPDIEDLETIRRRLRKGKSLTDSIKGVCSQSTWRKWKDQYPILAEMEEDAREWRKNRLEIEVMRIADQTDREKMGQNTRDKIQIDTRLAEIARIDKLTENRLQKQGVGNGTMVPIQINFGFKKPNP